MGEEEGEDKEGEEEDTILLLDDQTRVTKQQVYR